MTVRPLKFSEPYATAKLIALALPSFYVEDPFIFSRYLKAMEIDRETGFEEQALWELVSEEMERLTKDSWLRDYDAIVTYLRREVPKRARQLRKETTRDGLNFTQREIEQRKKRRKKVPPIPMVVGRQGRKRKVFEPFVPADIFCLPPMEKERFFSEARTILPNRQWEWLKRNFADETNREIAEKLGIEESTVRSHAKAVRENRELKAMLEYWLGKSEQSEKNSTKTGRNAYFRPPI